MTQRLLGIIARVAVAVLCLLPIRWVAHFGRGCGNLAYYADARHRRVALRNLTQSFSEMSEEEISEIARENFRRIGENICCAIKSASMSDTALEQILEVRQSGSPAAIEALASSNILLASGHFGNFELFSRLSPHFPRHRHASTYRAIRQAGLDEVLRGLREKNGLELFERRSGADLLKKELANGGRLLILLSDQSDRSNGLELPFLGRPAFTNRAAAVMAIRYDCSLFVPICYRVGVGQYRIELGEPIPTREPGGARRSSEEIMRDINLAFEAAIMRDPSNWFWVHNRWKTKLPAKGASAGVVASSVPA